MDHITISQFFIDQFMSNLQRSGQDQFVSFVWMGLGAIKEGCLNTAFKIVIPPPYKLENIMSCIQAVS